MAGYVGNLISYHDRREGEAECVWSSCAGTIPDVTPGPGVLQGSRADRWARRQARHRSGRFRQLAAVLPRRCHVKSIERAEGVLRKIITFVTLSTE